MWNLCLSLLFLILFAEVREDAGPPEVTVSQLTRRINVIAQRYSRWNTTAEQQAQADALYEAVRVEVPRFRIETRGKLQDVTWKDGWATLNVVSTTGELTTRPVVVSRPTHFKIPLSREESLQLRPQTTVVFTGVVELIDRSKQVQFPGTEEEPPTLYILRCTRPSVSLGQYAATSYTVVIGNYTFSYEFQPDPVESTK